MSQSFSPAVTKQQAGLDDLEKTRIYDGEGTVQDPFVVEFKRSDAGNPLNWSTFRKWLITSIVTSSVFALTFASSAFAESYNEVIEDFHISTEVFIVGVSLFVLGFAIGPAFWAPLYVNETSNPFVGGSAGSSNITTLLILRFFAGTFSGSPLVNSGGAIADLFPPAQRGLAMTLYCVAPFVGPILAPIVGGFVSENVGWRWVQGLCCILAGVIGVLGVIFVPETYGPVLLTQRAKRLSKIDGKIYISVLDKKGKKASSEVFKRALLRPWVFLFREPIVLVAATYMAIIYGTVYMFLGAMPIVYNEDRGWSEGTGGLSFLGILVGIVVGFTYAIYDNYVRYMKLDSVLA